MNVNVLTLKWRFYKLTNCAHTTKIFWRLWRSHSNIVNNFWQQRSAVQRKHLSLRKTKFTKKFTSLWPKLENSWESQRLKSNSPTTVSKGTKFRSFGFPNTKHKQMKLSMWKGLSKTKSKSQFQFSVCSPISAISAINRALSKVCLMNPSQSNRCFLSNLSSSELPKKLEE